MAKSSLLATRSLLCILMLGAFTEPGRAQTFLSPGNGAPPALPVIIGPDAQPRRSEATARREQGRYVFETLVNGAKLPMLFDTGASLIVLRSEDAARVGVDLIGLHYSQRVNTANGTTEVAPTTISTFSVGGITRRNVAAMVALPGKLSVNLLGQSFLARIAGYRLEGDELILQGE